MTCIVGLKHENNIIIAADSAGSNNGFIDDSGIEKIFSKSGYLIAYTTSFRMGQLLHHKIDLPKIPEKITIEFMVNEFVESIRSGFKNHGFSEISNNVETGGNFLVGVPGKLFEIHSDYQVKEINNFSCCGSGMYYAFGAMEALKDLPPITRVKNSIKIAEKYNPYVRSPVRVRMIKDGSALKTIEKVLNE